MTPRQLRRPQRGAQITVSYDIARCIHAEECTRGLPAVFDRARSNWIDPDGEPPERTTEVVLRCPSGALRVESPDGVDLESPASENRVQVVGAGPLYLRGDLALRTPEGELLHRDTRMALCRCGASGNKPFCDNSHLQIGFRSSRLFAGSQTVIEPGGELSIVPTRDGPYELQGNLTIHDDAGGLIYRGRSTRLCRCGASQEKPFCDDSHKEFDFEASEW